MRDVYRTFVPPEPWEPRWSPSAWAHIPLWLQILLIALVIGIAVLLSHH